MNAYQAYKFATENQLPLKSNLIDDDTKRLFHVVDYLIEKKGIGAVGAKPEEVMAEALRMVHGINPQASTKKATLKDIEAGLDTGVFDLTDLEEVTNLGLIASYVQDGVNIYMQLDGIGLEEALAAALQDARKDFITIEASNGTMQAISLLNTDISRTGGEAVKLQNYLNEYALSEEAQVAMQSVGATGLTLKSSKNRNKISVVMIDDSGRVIGNFMDVPLKVASDPATLRNMINERQRRQAEEDAFMTGQLGVVELTSDFDVRVHSPRTDIYLPDASNDQLNILALDGDEKAAEELRKRVEEENIYDVASTASYEIDGVARPVYPDAILRAANNPEVQRTIQQAIEDTFDVESYTEAAGMMGTQAEDTLNRILKTEAVRSMEGTDNEKKSVIKSVMDFLFSGEAEASRSDIAGDVENITGDTVESKAANLIISQEGFEPNPYPDGRDKSVGYGFYLPSLEADEKALIKDVNNITKEEANAVMKLKVQKLNSWWNKKLPNFKSLADEQQVALMSMLYQIGTTKLPKFDLFLSAITKASNAPEGSAERAEALKEAAFNMLYTRKADGSKVKTNWHKQTPKRAKAMAAVISE